MDFDIKRLGLGEQIAGGAGVVDVGGGHHHGEQKPQAVDPQMPLAAAPITTR